MVTIYYYTRRLNTKQNNKVTMLLIKTKAHLNSVLQTEWEAKSTTKSYHSLNIDSNNFLCSSP